MNTYRAFRPLLAASATALLLALPALPAPAQEGGGSPPAPEATFAARAASIRADEAQLRADKIALKAALDARLAQLQSPDREQLRAGIDSFRREHAEALAEHRARQKELRARARKLRLDEAEARRPDPALEVVLEPFRAQRKALHEQHRQFLRNLGALPPGERRAALEQDRAAERAALLQLNEAQMRAVRAFHHAR